MGDSPESNIIRSSSEWVLKWVAILILIASLIWLISEPGFEPLLGFLGAVAAWLSSRPAGEAIQQAVEDSQLTREQRNRRNLLDNVKNSWIKGVLQPVLDENAAFEINLNLQPHLVLRKYDDADYDLPSNFGILKIFEDMNQELLILGAPGAGKTILLLQLAKELIEQAERDEKKAIPLVFNLSSWAADRKPLEDWLIGQMRTAYGVPRKAGEKLIENEKMLPLLDGLDEVAEKYRNDCIQVINAFRQKYQGTKAVVCSRILDYETLVEKLDVRVAILLNPLGQSQIDRYLVGTDYQGLREVMRTDSVLTEFASTPFLLNTMAYCYKGLSKTNLTLPQEDNFTLTRRNDLFGRYVAKRLEATFNPFDYAKNKTRFWLAWLGMQLNKQNHTTLFIEGFEPQTLPSPWQVKLFAMTILLIFGLTYGLFYGLGGVLGGPLMGNVSGLLGIFLGGLIANLDHHEFGKRGVYFSRENLLLGLAIGLAGGIGGGLNGDIVFGLVSGLTLGLVSGLVWGLVGEKNRSLIISRQNFSNDPKRLSLRSSLINGLIWGLAGGLSGGIALGLVIALGWGLTYGLAYSLIVSLTIALGFGLLSGLIIGLMFGFALGLLEGLTIKLRGGIIGGGLGSAFLYQVFIIKHVVLRLMLTANGLAPLNYARFLDYAADAQILRKVGGGYVFRHRELQDYFARLNPPKP